MKLAPLLALVLSIQALNANDKIDIKPIIDLTIEHRYIQKDYTTLGQNIYGEESSSDGDYIFGGKVGFLSSYENYDLGLAIQGLAKEKDNDEAVEEYQNEILNNNFVGYSYLADAYIQANYENISTKIGRQSYNGSLINKNERITSNSYSGLLLEYKKDDLKIDAFYFNKIAASVLSTEVPQNHTYGILGYGMGYNVGDFTEISEYIIGEKKSTNGAINLNIKYGDDKTYINIENLYVDNFFNTFNLTARLNHKSDDIENSLKFGFITQNEVGDNHFDANIDSQLYQAQYKFSRNRFYLKYRISQSATNKDAKYNGTLISPFSNRPAWIVGALTAHAFIADTLSQQLLLVNTFYFGSFPLTAIAAHIRYDIGKDNGIQNTEQKTIENYLQFKGYFSKNLTLTTQFSVVKDIDILQEKKKRSRIFLSYKF